MTTFLKDHPGLNELGGANYLAKLAASAVAGFAVQDYAQLIYDLAIRRQLILLGKDISERLKMEIDQEPRDHIVVAELALYNWEAGKRTMALSPLKAVTEAVAIANLHFSVTVGLQEFQQVL